MYKNLAILNGSIIAIMVFFNGMLSNITGPYLSTLIFQVIGLVIIASVALIKKSKLPDLRKMPIILFIPGVLSIFTILLDNLCVPKIGVTLTSGLSIYGQLLLSNIVGHFGLFNTPVSKFRKEKLIGFAIISIGAIVMVTL